MIELTDEMVAAFRDAWMRSMQEDPRIDDPERIADRAGLAAVLALVERDYELTPIPPPCGASGPDGLTCQRNPKHRGHHGHVNGSALVKW